MSPRNENKIQLKPYTLKELAVLYGVCKKTIKRWLKPIETEIGQHDGRYYTIPQVKVIFARLGYPANITEN
jgi:hypothetical protein